MLAKGFVQTPVQHFLHVSHFTFDRIVSCAWSSLILTNPVRQTRQMSHFTNKRPEAQKGNQLVQVARGDRGMCFTSLSCVLSTTKHPLTPLYPFKGYHINKLVQLRQVFQLPLLLVTDNNATNFWYLLIQVSGVLILTPCDPLNFCVYMKN